MTRPQSETRFAQEHLEVTRRYFVGLGAAGALVASVPFLRAAAQEASRGGSTFSSELDDAIAKLEYLTRPEDFGTVERGNPLPYKLPPEQRLAVGLERQSWQLEVVADPETKARVDRPLAKELGTALTFDALMEIAKTRAVKYLKIMTCLNMGQPLGMGLWEGVPLRDVLWMARPVENIRRVFYYGYHNDDPQQMFRSSLPIGRVLEDPPGEYPVILCYKLNGDWISGKRGGPVRMLVPDAYGFKSIKWLQRVVLTNQFNANDTYERGNNDVDTKMKTFARCVFCPKAALVGEPIAITGLAQVGVSGLAKVQYWWEPAGREPPADDPHFTQAPWRDATILPPPKDWGSGIGTEIRPAPLGFEAATSRPKKWPMRYAKAHWAALLKDIPVGDYVLRCRTIDANGVAQPMPRPFAKSGRNSIQKVSFKVVA